MTNAVIKNIIYNLQGFRTCFNWIIEQEMPKHQETLKVVEKDSGFTCFREKNIVRLFKRLTLFAMGLVLTWYIFDLFYFQPILPRLFLTRMITIFAYAINLMVALYLFKLKYVKTQLVIGFYIGAIFTGFITYFTGGAGSSYSVGLSFLLIAWLGLLPFNYKYLIGHAVLFILIYSAINILLGRSSINLDKLIEVNFIFLSILMIGSVVAINNHESAAKNFLTNKTLKESFNQLKNTNDRLEKEIQLKKETGENLKKFSFIIDQAPGSVIMTDKKGNIQYSNPFFSTITGYTKEELLGKNIREIETGLLESGLYGEMWQKVSNGGIWQGEFPSEKKNGEKYWKGSIVAPFKDEQGITTGYVSIQQDITDKRQIEQALRDSEEKYRMLIHKARDGIIITQDGKFKFVNKAFCDMIGYAEDELLEKPFTMFLSSHERERLMEIHQRRMKGEKFPLIYSTESITKNGDPIFFELNSTTIDYEGRPAAFIITRDFTGHKKAEDALKESERQFRELADLLPQTIYELDIKGNITFTNKAGFNTFGIKPEDLSNGLPASKFFIPRDQKRMVENFEKTIKGEKFNPQEYTALDKNGEEFPVIIYGSPMVKNEELIGSRGIIIDISDRKIMEDALRRSEEKYRVLIQSLQDGMFVIQDGKFVFLNESIVDLVGYSIDELVGKEFLSVIAPENRQEVLDIHIKRIKGEAAPAEYESFLIKRDQKTRVPVILSVGLINFDGKPATIGTAKDITERKKNESVIHESEQKFRSITASAQDSIIMLSPGGSINYWNEASEKIFGYSASEVLGKNIYDIITPGNLKKEYTAKLEQLLAGKISIPKGPPLELKGKRKNGETFPYELSVSTFKLNNEWHAVGILRDITERKKAEQALKDAREKLQVLNRDLEKTVEERTNELTKANTLLLKLQKENLQSQFDMLKNQVNPHFLFNSLNVLISLIKLDADLAEKFTEQLSKVYRYVLENKEKDLVTIETELDFLQSYIFLLKIRFSEKLQVKIDIASKYREWKIIPLALQLLIENAIKHNTFSRRNPLVISVFSDDNHLLNVRNNLQVRDTDYPSTGVGLKNITNRYELISDTKPVFERAEDEFIAQIPLLQ